MSNAGSGEQLSDVVDRLQAHIAELHRSLGKEAGSYSRYLCYRTLEASTGGQALRLATEHGPALVLMDIRLPDMDGVEALSRLRMDGRTASIPVLAVTAQAMQGDRERFKESGFDGYLSKPVDIDELLTTIDQHLRPVIDNSA